MWETADVMAYQAIVEDLRETMFWDGYAHRSQGLRQSRSTVRVAFGAGRFRCTSVHTAGIPRPLRSLPVAPKANRTSG